MREIIELILMFSLILIISICFYFTGDLAVNGYEIMFNNININNQRLILDIFGAACMLYICKDWNQTSNK